MIEVKELFKTFGRIRAVDGISFSVEKGEILGFLGPNGAGKSTAIRMLTGYLPPTSGNMVVAGYPVPARSLEARRHIGYLPETNPLYSEMRTVEFLKFVARFRRIPRRERASKIRRVVGSCHLEEVLSRPIGKLSKGFRQRVGLAQAIMHDPQILFLDEPTSGLDPRQVLGVRDLMRSLARDRTVIMSTHILAEIEANCNRIQIIHEGKLVAEGTLDELRRRHQEEARIVAILEAAKEAVLETLPGESELRGTEVQDTPSKGQVRLIARGKDVEVLKRKLFELARAKGWVLLELREREPTLEEIFLKVTGQEEAA